MGANKILSKNERREWRDPQRARIFASVNCAHYRECRDQAAFANKRMQCHKCDRMEIDPDICNKERGAHMLNHYDPGAHPARIDSGHGVLNLDF